MKVKFNVFILTYKSLSQLAPNYPKPPHSHSYCSSHTDLVDTSLSLHVHLANVMSFRFLFNITSSKRFFPIIFYKIRQPHMITIYAFVRVHCLHKSNQILTYRIIVIAPYLWFIIRSLRQRSFLGFHCLVTVQ